MLHSDTYQSSMRIIFASVFLLSSGLHASCLELVEPFWNSNYFYEDQTRTSQTLRQMVEALGGARDFGSFRLGIRDVGQGGYEVDVRLLDSRDEPTLTTWTNVYGENVRARRSGDWLTFDMNDYGFTWMRFIGQQDRAYRHIRIEVRVSEHDDSRVEEVRFTVWHRAYFTLGMWRRTHQYEWTQSNP